MICHPASPAPTVDSVTVAISVVEDRAVRLRYVVVGALDDIVIPAPGPPARVDGLWRTTCFELFVKTPSSAGYSEYNFSPSASWAAYTFDAYRGGMQLADVDQPKILGHRSTGMFVMDVDLVLPVSVHNPILAGCSAVIEDSSGRKSYWALAHPPGEPDFHHEDCFAVRLVAPESA
ncbi:MAG: DOMON-like domain-containing protein [Sphingopyxis sp.]|nr:DOMON-like domain-containing protein [Sphingopyxis sp.]